MVKKILAWALAIFVSFMILNGIFRLLAFGATLVFYTMTYIMIAIITLIVAIPFYMIIKKKWLK